MYIIAQTARLTIRQFLSEEEHLFVGLLSDERVTPYLPKRDSGENRKIFHDTLNDYRNEVKFTRWGIFNMTGDYIGFGMLKSSEQDPNMAELGYVIAPQFKGAGIATEMATALINYGFNEAGLTEIFAVTVPANLASQKVLLKTGLTPGKDIMRNGIWLSYYKITAEGWRLK